MPSTNVFCIWKIVYMCAYLSIGFSLLLMWINLFDHFPIDKLRCLFCKYITYISNILFQFYTYQ